MDFFLKALNLFLFSPSTHDISLLSTFYLFSIGEIYVPLKELAEGLPIMDIFPLKSSEGKNAGNLQISMRWKHPFRKSRELGPKSLTGIEVETLISAFSAGEMSEGLISYRDFCRFIDPPRDVLRTMEKLRTYAQKMYLKDNIKSTDLFRILFDMRTEDETIKEDTFTQVFYFNLSTVKSL